MTTERETQTQAVPANTIAKDVLDVILSGEETPEKRSFLDSWLAENPGQLRKPVPVPTRSRFDDPQVWRQENRDFTCPLSDSDMAEAQKEIDSIVGTGRDGRPILKLVWSGDTRYWDQIHMQHNTDGSGKGDPTLRPRLLYKSVYGPHGKLEFDCWVPRFMLLTLIEPEQYENYRNETKYFDPVLRVWVQVLPTEPPKDYYVWFMTIAEHACECCQIAAKDDMACYGRYAHPRHAIPHLQYLRKVMDADPHRHAETQFDKPDRMARRLRSNQTANYPEQAIKSYRAQMMHTLDVAPLAFASGQQLERMNNGELKIGELRRELKEEYKRNEDAEHRRLLKEKRLPRAEK